MAKQYYSLVAGLEELTLEADHKGFDAVALREQIAAELSDRDLRALRTFYAFYDVENVLAALNGKQTHNPLGNYSPEQLAEALAAVNQPQGESDVELPGWMNRVLRAYKAKDEGKTDDEVDTSGSLENALWNAFYAQCAASSNRFVREWFAFDNTLRNISAAYIARNRKWPVAEQLVGDGDVVKALSQSSAADFGLRGEIDYIESVVALLDMKNMLEKEQRLDQIRWAKAGELTTFDYFDLNTLLAYLAKANIIQRWTVLDRKQGEAMLGRLLAELSDKSILQRAEAQQ